MNVFLRNAMVGTTLLPILASCSTSVKEFQASPNVSQATLARDGLVLLGCTATVGKVDDVAISDEMCPSLATALKKVHPSVNVTPWPDVKVALGDEALLYLSHVRGKGSLAVTDIDSVAAAFTKPRYVVVHRIERDETSFDEDDVWEDVEGEQKKVGKKYQTKRSMTASFWIYDLRSHERVWMSTIDSNKQNEVTIRGDVNPDNVVGDFLDAVGTVDDVLGTHTPEGKPYPLPPASTQVMGQIYDKFSEKLLKD